MSSSEARFTINVKDGIVELEGKESFVDKHLEKFEEIFKTALREAITRGFERNAALETRSMAALPQEPTPEDDRIDDYKEKTVPGVAKHPPRTPPVIHLIPVDLKPADGKMGLREFYKEKKPSNHYEKVAVFVYYLTKFSKHQEVRYGEILSCYEEVNEKKPSILDIIKNTLRYKGWLEPGSEKYATRLTVSGENYVKFDLPSRAAESIQSSLE